MFVLFLVLALALALVLALVLVLVLALALVLVLVLPAVPVVLSFFWFVFPIILLSQNTFHDFPNDMRHIPETSAPRTTGISIYAKSDVQTSSFLEVVCHTPVKYPLGSLPVGLVRLPPLSRPRRLFFRLFFHRIQLRAKVTFQSCVRC